ncbi:MAG: hypothetical protein WKH64_04340 [Chloroflexia bacterium]
MEKERGAYAALENSDYGFAAHLLTKEFLKVFARHMPKMRNARVTRLLLNTTKSEKFTTEFRRAVKSSPIVRSRLPHLEQALSAHQRGEYLLSIPCLLNVIEGVVGDVLVLKGHVIKDGHKLYELNADGTHKLDAKNRKIEIAGLNRAVEIARKSEWKDHDILRGVADIFANRVIKERNGINHGRYVNYGKANLSVRAILLIFVLSIELSD